MKREKDKNLKEKVEELEKDVFLLKEPYKFNILDVVWLKSGMAHFTRMIITERRLGGKYMSPGIYKEYACMGNISGQRYYFGEESLSKEPPTIGRDENITIIDKLPKHIK